VESFEPMDECASVIAAYGHPSIRVHKMALSDKKGVMTLRFPMANSRPLAGLATLENTAESTSTGTRQVDVRRLDDFEFTDVGFIKIDVEGHESSVIDGAIETVQTSRPVLLIEIEQRHHGDDPIEQIMSRICGLGYEGGFYWGGIFLPLGEFSPVIHQSGENLYTNKYEANFLFRPT
jgi:FkbM family methyltransferase